MLSTQVSLLFLQKAVKLATILQFRRLPVGYTAFFQLLLIADSLGLLRRVGSLLVDHKGYGLFPPGIVGFTQAMNDLRVLGRHVLLFVRIRRDVVENPVVDEAPALRTYRAALQLALVRVGSLLPAALVDEKVPVRPLTVGFLEQRQQRAPVDFLDALGDGSAGELAEGLEQVDVGGERRDVDSLAQLALPAPEGGDVGAAFVLRALAGFEAPK